MRLRDYTNDDNSDSDSSNASSSTPIAPSANRARKRGRRHRKTQETRPMKKPAKKKQRLDNNFEVLTTSSGSAYEPPNHSDATGEEEGHRHLKSQSSRQPRRKKLKLSETGKGGMHKVDRQPSQSVKKEKKRPLGNNSTADTQPPPLKLITPLFLLVFVLACFNSGFLHVLCVGD